jgi:hypothetical protein
MTSEKKPPAGKSGSGISRGQVIGGLLLLLVLAGCAALYSYLSSCDSLEGQKQRICAHYASTLAEKAPSFLYTVIGFAGGWTIVRARILQRLRKLWRRAP